MKLSNKLFAAALLASVFTSCINEDYDLTKINTEMTVLPELSVPVSKEIEGLGANTLMNLSGSSVKADSEGNFSISSAKSSMANMTLSAESLSNGVTVNDTLHIAFNGVPSFLQSEDCAFSLSNPQIRFSATNPSTSDLVIKARATAYGEAIVLTRSEATRSAEITAVIPAGAYNTTVFAESASIEGLFSPIPEYITIDEIEIISSEEVSAENVKLSLQGSANVPLCFEAGSSVTVDYTIDTKSLGIDLSGKNISTGDFKAACSVISTFPLDFDVEVSVAGPATSVSLDKVIGGGSIDCPATTDLNANFSCEGNITDINKVTLHITATNKSGENVTLNDSMALSIAISELLLTDGITVSL